jgi:hypothetical protein
VNERDCNPCTISDDCQYIELQTLNARRLNQFSTAGVFHAAPGCDLYSRITGREARGDLRGGFRVPSLLSALAASYCPARGPAAFPPAEGLPAAFFATV